MVAPQVADSRRTPGRVLCRSPTDRGAFPRVGSAVPAGSGAAVRLVAGQSGPRHTAGVNLHEPEPEAYGRVTNPERYRVVVDAAQTLARQLVDTFDVAASTGDAAADFPTYRGAIEGTIRLVPSLGVPLIFALTRFPGVLIRRGEGEMEAFPSCGCDACDEAPAEVIRAMTGLVQTAVDGRYEEVLFRRPLLHSFLSRFAHLSVRRRSSLGYLRRSRRFWRGVGRQPRRRVVCLGPPWPRRQGAQTAGHLASAPRPGDSSAPWPLGG